MKTIYVIILVLFFYNFTTAQEELDSPLIEIFTLVEDSSPNPSGNYSFTLTSMGTAWKVIPYNIYLNDYDISNEVSGGTVYPIINIIYSGYTGFNYIAHGDHNYPEFGFGLYKIECSTGNYFYLDYRDTRYGKYTGCTGHCADIWVKYDVNSEEIRLASTAGGWSDAIPNRAYLKIWDIKGQGVQVVTERVDDFWINSLVLIPSQTGNNPRLVWGPYPSSSITVQAYKIYRKYGSSPFVPCTTLSANTFQFTDESVYLSIPGGQAGTDVQYKVTAIYNTNLETPFTNTVTANIQGDEIEKRSYSIPVVIDKYKLEQSYPNPFNPSTVISYSVRETGLVKLRVYDILGSEVATLINETKEAGNFTVEFNAANLPSGVYIYTLQVNAYTNFKKMLLLK